MSSPHLFRKHCRFLHRRRGRSSGRIARRLRRGWRGWWHGCRHGTWGALENAPGVRCWKHRGLARVWMSLSMDWFLPSTIGVSCKFSHHPILCLWLGVEFKHFDVECRSGSWKSLGHGNIKAASQLAVGIKRAAANASSQFDHWKFVKRRSDGILWLSRSTVTQWWPSLSQLPWPLTNSKAGLALTRYETP